MNSNNLLLLIPSGEIIENYRFDECIDHGGFADIYIVTSLKFGQQFVAKVITVNKLEIEEVWDTFNKEVKALIKLDHPNIIRLYDRFRIFDRFFLILEYCSGGNLYQEVLKLGSLSITRFTHIFSQIVSALNYSHSQGIVHHDIKPQNILFDNFGRPKLADFGICLDIRNEVFSENFHCSLDYAPPEIISKKLHDPFKADIWSLGITFIFSLTGDLPFLLNSEELLKQSILNGSFLIKNSLPNEFKNIIINMIKLNPNSRPSTNDLLKFCEKLPIPNFKSNNIIHPIKTNSDLIKPAFKNLNLISRPIPPRRRYSGVFSLSPTTSRTLSLP